MKIEFTRTHVIAIVLAVVLCIGFGAGGYFLLLQPEREILEQKESDLHMFREELTIVEQKSQQIEEQTVVGSMELQKQVPVKPLLEQLLLDIEKAELLSDSTVLDLKVGSTDEEVEFPVDEEADNETESEEADDVEEQPGEEVNENEEENEEENENENEEETTTGQQIEFLPKGMKTIKVNILAEANSYFEIEKFIDVLQSLQRIVRIDEVKFTGQEEITSVDDEISSIPFEIILTAFYYPNLADLQDELPKLDRPDPANKKNPFNSFSTNTGT